MDDALNVKLGWAFLPWVVFDLVVRVPAGGTEFAAATATGVALVIGRTSFRRGTATAVEGTSLCVFGLLLVVASVAAPGPAMVLARGAMASCTAVLAVVMGLTLLASPATMPYARRCVGRRAAASPRFAVVNTSLTAMWALALALVAGSQAVGAAASSPTLIGVFDWLVPLGTVVTAARGTSAVWVDYLECSATAISARPASTAADPWDVGLWPSEDA